MIRKVLMYWIQGNTGRKPTCSLSTKRPSCSLMRSMIIFTSSRSTFQLSHSRRLSFLTFLTIILFLHSLGKLSNSQDLCLTRNSKGYKEQFLRETVKICTLTLRKCIDHEDNLAFIWRSSAYAHVTMACHVLHKAK